MQISFMLTSNSVPFHLQDLIITLLVVFSAFFISPTSECLGPILELNVSRAAALCVPFFYPYRSRSFDILSAFILSLTQGLLSAIPLSYILPGLIFLKLDPTPLFSREKLPAIALVGFGLVVSISGELWRRAVIFHCYGGIFVRIQMAVAS